MTVHVLPVRAHNLYSCPEVSTVSNYGGIYTDLSPFVLGPVQTYEVEVYAQRFENLWQYSKVYKEHLDVDGNPSVEWFAWRARGWADMRAHRYPMGRGRKPEYSWWEEEKLGYIDARKQIYAKVYAKRVVQTRSYDLLKLLYFTRGEVVLRDYDAYDHIKMGMSLRDVINNPNQIMGHAFVLAMMLENKLEECLE